MGRDAVRTSKSVRHGAADSENRVLILTGTGDEFNGPKAARRSFPGNAAWRDSAHWNVRRLLTNLLDIEAPVIAAINGPAWRHAETPLLSDIVLASATTCSPIRTLRERPRAGDGMH